MGPTEALLQRVAALQAGNFLAYAYAPATLVAPLGAVTVRRAARPLPVNTYRGAPRCSCDHLCTYGRLVSGCHAVGHHAIGDTTVRIPCRGGTMPRDTVQVLSNSVLAHFLLREPWTNRNFLGCILAVRHAPCYIYIYIYIHIYVYV